MGGCIIWTKREQWKCTARTLPESDWRYKCSCLILPLQFETERRLDRLMSQRAFLWTELSHQEKHVPAAELHSYLNSQITPFSLLARMLSYRIMSLKRIGWALRVCKDVTIKSFFTCETDYYVQLELCTNGGFPLRAVSRWSIKKYNQCLNYASRRATNRTEESWHEFSIRVFFFTVCFNVVDALSHKLEPDFIQFHCEGKQKKKEMAKWAGLTQTNTTIDN